MEAQQNHTDRRQTKFPYPKLVSPETTTADLTTKLTSHPPAFRIVNVNKASRTLKARIRTRQMRKPRGVTVRVTAPLPVYLSPKGFPAAIESKPAQGRSRAFPSVPESPFVKSLQVKNHPFRMFILRIGINKFSMILSNGQILSIWKIRLSKLPSSLSTGVKWRQFMYKDLLISI